MPRRDYSSDSRSRSRTPDRRRAHYHRRDSCSRSRSPRRRPASRSSPPSRQSHHYRSRSPRQHDGYSPPRRRDRSPSPYRRDRSRSRSPPRRKEARSNMSGGFKWKDKPASTAPQEEPKSLSRSYREQEKLKERSPIRDDVRSKFGDDYQTKYVRKQPTEQDDVAAKFGTDATASKIDSSEKTEKRKEKKEKKSKVKGPKPTSEPMIIVNVNDRLGTKAQIPCLASDPVKLFKALVAAKIGREPHEIKLQRQGERPFKDQLTLEDYGVSNGVQLDLEVDTGD